MKTYLLTFFIFTCGCSFGQSGEWTWISGTDSTGSLGVFGIQGIPSANNHPPGSYEPIEWKDKQGNFWLYAGYPNELSDLWKYDPVSNEWTWMKGTGLPFQSPIYGMIGIPDPANTPGTRWLCAVSWVDTAGNLWLFGDGHMNNDLWKYEIGTNSWTWESGSNFPNASPVYGIQGIPSPSNIPGPRCETASAWTDAQNNLWLFGGSGVDVTISQGYLDDLWKYDIINNEWTWMKGSDTAYVFPNYGVKGLSNQTNDPGARETYTKWKDSQGNFWLMGGEIYTGITNDTWKYEIGINQWTWMAGPNIPSNGIYQSTCVFDSINIPKSRMENRSAITDYCGNFWMFGGGAGVADCLNDLWVFDSQQIKWNWISGTNMINQSGSYGILGVTSNSNMPPSRIGAVAWCGNDNRFYLFGGCSGSVFNSYSDLWVFTRDSNCIANCNYAIPSANIQNSYLEICPGTCTSFLNLSINATSYLWSFPGANPSTSTDVNPSNICYSNPGTYDVQLIASNANGSDTLLLTNYITVYPSPPPQSITQIGDTLFAIAGSASYQWYFNGNIINGATDYFYVAPASGDYNVVATDLNGCEVEAVVFNVVAEVDAIGEEEIMIFPNPVEDKVIIQKSKVKRETAVEISVYNVIGEKMEIGLSSAAENNSSLEIDVHTWAAGLYYIEIRSTEKTFRSKFVKQ